jgi:hypothetical protein
VGVGGDLRAAKIGPVENNDRAQDNALVPVPQVIVVVDRLRIGERNAMRQPSWRGGYT